MNEESSTFEDLISPDLPEDTNSEQISLVSEAAETAKSQSEMRDFLSLTLGNLFAFFAILFPPIIAKIADVQTGISDQVEHDSDSEPKD